MLLDRDSTFFAFNLTINSDIYSYSRFRIGHYIIPSRNRRSRMLMDQEFFDVPNEPKESVSSQDSGFPCLLTKVSIYIHVHPFTRHQFPLLFPSLLLPFPIFFIYLHCIRRFILSLPIHHTASFLSFLHRLSSIVSSYHIIFFSFLSVFFLSSCPSNITFPT